RSAPTVSCTVVPAAFQGVRAVSLGSTTIISSARSCSPIKPKPNAWAIFPPPIKATRFGCVLIGASDTFDIYQFPLDELRNLYGLMLDLPKYYCPLGRNRGMFTLM